MKSTIEKVIRKYFKEGEYETGISLLQPSMPCCYETWKYVYIRNNGSLLAKFNKTKNEFIPLKKDRYGDWV